MKLIGITQRVSMMPKTAERRDALDQKWASLLHECTYTPYPIPNHLPFLSSILELPLNGIILTGGNTLDTNAPERDALERAIIEYAISHSLPILGVCRGMQLILDYFGSSLERIAGHIGTIHPLQLQVGQMHVNSYHEYGAYTVQPPLQVMGRANDGVIEAVKHLHLPIYGIMWHPERNNPFTAWDLSLLRQIFL
jgi:putative glutamine amidotransferase